MADSITPRSEAALERALKVIPEGSQTLSKASSQFVKGIAPLFIERGDGARVWDVDGREFIDWPMALGPILLGYRHPEVDAAIKDQLERGITFTLPSPIEADVAERIVDAIPSAEMVRFAKTGSEATAAAVRLARAITGRDLVISAGYHGWHDWYAGGTPRPSGVPEAVTNLTRHIESGNLQTLRQAIELSGEDLAAVIVEPAGARPPPPGYLEEAVASARRAGAVVIFDEIVTGLRWARGGAQERYGVTPDLTTLGKALGNGMPISAVCGPGEMMKAFDSVFFSGTHGGEAVSLAAARATLDFCNDHPVVDEIWRKGARLKAGISAAISEAGLGDRVECVGEPPRTVVRFPANEIQDGSFEEWGGEDLVTKSLLQQEVVKRGILFNGSLFPSWSHTDAEVDQTVSAFAEAFGVVADAIGTGNPGNFLDGEPVAPVFRTP